MRYNLRKIAVYGVVGFALFTMLLAPAPAIARVQTTTKTACDALGGNWSGTGQLGSCTTPDTPIDPTKAAQNDPNVPNIPIGTNTSEITCNSLSSCVILLVYYVGPGLAGNVAYVGAYFFSMVVQLSLNSTAYALDFLSAGWTTVRDVANMAFIFILIYIALTVMLFAETSGTIKTLAVVVVVALLVNFSFFFTRLVIDAGNITAVQFYNAIPYQGSIEKSSNTKDLSLSIMNAVRPQELLNGAMLDRVREATKGSLGFGAVGVYLVLFLSVAAMFWMLFFAFLQVGVKFMLRIVGLWFVLIASPLAFVARTMPKTKHFFDQWWDYLFKFSFYPAIFLFMFWILTKFTNSVLSSGTGGVGNGSLLNALFNTPTGTSVELGTMAVIATVAIRMGFVITVLYVGLRVSEWLVKEGSATAAKVSGGVFSAGKFAAKWGPGWAAGAAYRWTGGAVANAASKGLANSAWANRTGTLRGAIGYRLNRNILKPMTETSLGTVASTYKGRSEFLDKRKAEMDSNLVNRSARKDADRLAEINKTWEQDDAQLEMWRGQIKRGIKLDPPAEAKHKRLEELNTERAILARRAENMTTSQATSLKASTVEGIIKQISESNLKAIKESGKHSTATIKEITTKWHEEHKKAPMAESRKQLEELGKIREILKKKKFDTGLTPAFEKLTAAVKGEVTSLKGAEEARKQATEMREKLEDTRDRLERRDPAGIAAGLQAKEFKKAEDKLDKLIEKLKEVPEGTGGEAAPAAFKNP